MSPQKNASVMDEITTFFEQHSRIMENMTKIVATPAPKPRSETVKRAAWVYAASLVVMVVAQLFAFEDFIPQIKNYALPGGTGTASLVAGLIVMTEIFAVPFLLRMPLSTLMRWCSLVCAVVAASLWVMLSVWAMATDAAITNSALLGTKVTVPAGFIALATSLTLFVLAAWSAWGLWPNARKNKRVTSSQ